MTDNAPIVLFVFKRPEHTKRVLESLQRNPLAEDSTLHIYADGPSPDASSEEIEDVAKVRELIRSRRWCGRTVIVEAAQNQGLSRSVVAGVTSVVESHGKVIVLEDDTVPAPEFLRFMNHNLRLYEHDRAVAGVGGWSLDVEADHEAYFTAIGGCWGWGTWRRVWANVNLDGEALLRRIEQSGRETEFNADGHYPYAQMLRNQVAGRIDSWAIRFYASYFLRRQLFLVPKVALVSNLGADGSGAHAGSNRALAERRLPSSPLTLPAAPLPVYEDRKVRARVVARLGEYVNRGSEGTRANRGMAWLRRALRRIRLGRFPEKHF